jgi:membrane protein
MVQLSETERQRIGRMALTAARVKRGAGIAWRACVRVFERDVMLFAGGVSFFGLLAVFPSVSLALSFYAALTSPEQAESQVRLLASVVPPDARALILDQVRKAIDAPIQALSLQGVGALLIAIYATVRGIKGLLAGLHMVAEEPNPRGPVAFNIQAVVVSVFAALFGFLASSLLIALPVILNRFLPDAPARAFLTDSSLWAFAGMTIALALLYRYSLRREPTSWSAVVIGGAVASVIWIGLSKLFVLYGGGAVEIGFAYGSVAAVAVFLSWMHLSAYAVFYGAALAAEIEDFEREGAVFPSL